MSIDLPIHAERFPVEVVTVRASDEDVTVAEVDVSDSAAQRTVVPGGPTLVVRPMLRAADGQLIGGDELEVHLLSPEEDVRVGDKIVFGALTASVVADRNGAFRLSLTAAEVRDAGAALREFRIRG